MLTARERQRWEALRRLFCPPLPVQQLELEPPMEFGPGPAIEPAVSVPARGLAAPVDLDQPVAGFLAGLDWSGGLTEPQLVPAAPAEPAGTAREFLAHLPWSGQREPALAPSGLPNLLALATNTALAAARRRAEPTGSAAAFFRNLPWNLPIGA